MGRKKRSNEHIQNWVIENAIFTLVFRCVVGTNGAFLRIPYFVDAAGNCNVSALATIISVRKQFTVRRK